MVESERNEHGRTVTGPVLRKMCAQLAGNPLLKVTPGGRELLTLIGTLRAWVGEVEAELLAFDARLQYQRATALPEDLREKLYGLLSVGRAEGQLEVPIPDDARPGGRAGDLVGGR